MITHRPPKHAENHVYKRKRSKEWQPLKQDESKASLMVIRESLVLMHVKGPDEPNSVAPWTISEYLLGTSQPRIRGQKRFGSLLEIPSAP